MPTVRLGKKKSNPKEQVVWDTKELVNGHWMLVGGSGTGKTHQIRHILNTVKDQGVKAYIFDPHGDIIIDEQLSSSVRFHETCPYGINPLVINPDPYYGGVRRRINSFISMVNRYSTQLDYKQEAALRHLMKDLYASRGIEHDKPETWSSGAPPTLTDLKNSIYGKLKAFTFGNLHYTSRFLSDMSFQMAELRRFYANDNKSGIVKEKIDAIKTGLKEAFIEYIEFANGDDGIDEYIRYESADTLKAVYDRIENIEGLGVFKSQAPPFDTAKPIHHYDMGPLYIEEQGYMVELSLEQIFVKATQDGFKTDIDTMIVLDEAQRFFSSEDHDHIISVISREGRKFGIGLVLATQNCASFTDDIIINSGTRVILGVDEAYLLPLSKAMGIDPNRVRFTQPKKTALIQLKTATMSGDSRFNEVVF